MTISHHVEPLASPEPREILSKRLDGIGWGLLLILTGLLWLIPEQQVPRGAWLIGTGVLLLALNGVRSAAGIGARPLTVLLGAVALAAGLSDFLGLNLPFVALGLIVLGAGILARHMMGRAA